jgi:ureidoglycolate dehydrogenase (NAD+)
MTYSPIAVPRLYQFIKDLTRKAGLEESPAHLLADTLIEADLKGIRTHGLLRLPIYIKRMETGVVDVRRAMTATSDRGSVAQLDAGNGLGQAACVQGMALAIAKAEQSGMGACGIRNSNHCGALGYYTDLAAEKKMIGFCTTNVFPLMAPTGGREKVVGNNPFAFSIPRLKDPPITYDVATSTVSYGRVLTYLRRGENIPLGWVLDGQGRDTDNPEELISRRGSLTPFAGHKGYGLAFVMEIFSALLTGASFGRRLHSMYDADHPAGLGHFLLVLNIAFFLDPDIFFQHLEEWVAEVKGSERTNHAEEILIPGEVEQRNKALQGQTGLVYEDLLLDEINLLAHKYGLPPLGRP